MLIQIESGDAKDPRKVVVSDETGELASFSAASLSEAHKMIAAGRKDGWDSVTPAKLAVQTKAATTIETGRVESGKRAAAPKNQPKKAN